jgi:hypothetical protein
MTIRKGEEWGIQLVAPDGLVLLRDDKQLAQMEQTAIGSLSGGDIHNALGAPVPVQPGVMCTQLEIDAMYVEIQTSATDEYSLFASSSVEVGLLRPSLVRKSQYACVTNGGLIQGRNLAPRAHPNDGVLDSVVFSKEMSFRERLLAMRKAMTGTHVPHPLVHVSRAESFSFMRTSRNDLLFVDGEKMPLWQSVRVTVQPDYWKIVV